MTRRGLVGWVAVVAGAVLGLSSCGGEDVAGMAEDSGGDAGTAGSGATGGGGGSGGAAGNGGSGGGPPERELEGSFRAPVVVGETLWSANPESGRVARVNAVTLEVETLEAGDGPTHLVAVPERERVLVLNVRSQDATLLSTSGGGSLTLPVHAGADSWAVAPRSRHAVAWSDWRRRSAPAPTDGFQDVTVLTLDAGGERAARLSVGYRPEAVRFDAEGRRALVVTEPGITVIDLARPEPEVIDLVELDAGSTARDVSITPEGQRAIVRSTAEPRLTILPLDRGQPVDVQLPAIATDLDLSDDGRLLVAALRSTGQAAVLELARVLVDPNDYELHTFAEVSTGSVVLSLGAEVALFFSNATANDFLGVLRLDTPGALPRAVNLKAPVLAAFTLPDAAHAVVLQSPAAGSTRAGAFSVVPTLEARAPKIVATEAPPLAVATGTAGDRALVTVGGDAGGHGVYLVRLPSLQVDFQALASRPLSVGILESGSLRRGWIAQRHPEGRLSFLDLDTGALRTITGFELGARVRGD